MQQVASNLAKKAALWSREFDGLIRAIGECKSKAEEDAIIACEVEVLKPRLKDARLDKRLLKEFLLRLIYVEMLGHDASWGHVKALQACSDTSLVTKKVAHAPATLLGTCLRLQHTLTLCADACHRSHTLRRRCSWTTRATSSS